MANKIELVGILPTEQEILDKNERQHLIDKIRKTFDWQSNTTNFTLNQLRDVVKTLMLS